MQSVQSFIRFMNCKTFFCFLVALNKTGHKVIIVCRYKGLPFCISGNSIKELIIHVGF